MEHRQQQSRATGPSPPRLPRGDSRERSREASGSGTDSYAFTAFGVPVATSGTTTKPHRYIGALGYYTDPTTGLDYVRARYLRPTTGSWLSVDPIASEPRYQYVGGRVTRAVDAGGTRWAVAPSVQGTIAGFVTGGIGGAIAGGLTCEGQLAWCVKKLELRFGFRIIVPMAVLKDMSGADLGYCTVSVVGGAILGTVMTGPSVLGGLVGGVEGWITCYAGAMVILESRLLREAVEACADADHSCRGE